MPDDAECLRQYAESRDQSAFSEFVHRNLGLVYSAAFRQTGGDVHLAEDITQVVFVAAARKATTLGRHPVIGAWLHQTTRNAAIDALRARQSRQVREEAAGRMTEILAGPDAGVDWDKVSPELDEIVATLGERDRAAIILRYFGRKTFAEIGAQFHVSEGAARMRVERALEKMRARFARRGVVSSGAALGAILVEKGLVAAPVGLGSASIAAALSAPAAGGLASVLSALRNPITGKGIAAAVAVISLVTAVYEHHRAGVAERALMDPALLTTREQTAADRTSSNPARTATQSSPAADESLPATAAAVANGVSSAPSSIQLALLNNPAMQKQASIQARVRLDGQYAALFRTLGLTPDQCEKFKDLLLEKEMVGFDSIASAHQKGFDPASDPQGFFQVFTTAAKTVDGQIAALLGAAGYSLFQGYQKTIAARNTCDLLLQALSYSSAPLTSEEANRLIPVLTECGRSPVPPDSPFAVFNSDLGVIELSEQGRARIREILPSLQFQVLEKKIQEQRQLLQARERLARQLH